MMPSESRKKLWFFIGLFVVVVLFTLQGRALVGSWPAVTAYPWTWNGPRIILSVIFMQIGYMIFARSWRAVLSATGTHLHFKKAFWIFYISNLGRYIPGKVWQVGVAALIGRQLGMTGGDLATSMVVHLLYFVPVGLALALSSGRFPSPYDTQIFYVTAWILTGASAAAAVFPDVLFKAVRPIARILKIVPERWRIPLPQRFAIAVQTALGWIAMSVGFAFLVTAITPVSMSDAAGLGRAFILAHLVGYVAFVAPGGLGVREGALALLLQPIVGIGPATAIALLTRFWETLCESFALVIALIWAGKDRKNLFP